MIYVHNILILPLLLVAWTIDAYLLLATARLILGRLSVTRESRLCQAMQELVDPVPQYVERRLPTRLHKSRPQLASWILVVIGAVIVRHIVLMIASNICQS